MVNMRSTLIRTIARIFVFLFAIVITYIALAQGIGNWSLWSPIDILEIANKNSHVGDIVVAIIPVISVSLAAAILYSILILPEEIAYRKSEMDLIFRLLLMLMALVVLGLIFYTAFTWSNVRAKTLPLPDLELLRLDLVTALAAALILEVLVAWRTEWFAGQRGRP